MTAHVVDRSPHGLVVVTGADATSFLQSLVSQDLEPIGDGEGARSLLLSPKGKLDAEFRVLHVGDEWWLDGEAEVGPKIAQALARYRIRVKVEIEDRSAATGLLTLVGAVPAGLPVTPHGHTELDGLRVIRTDWAGTAGADFLGPRDRVRAELERRAAEADVWDPDGFERFRIESGQARYGRDIDESTIPQEAFLDRDAVSFTKGCFLGQELVARIDSRGHVNRYLRQLRSEGASAPPAGATVVADGREVGAVTSATASEDGEHASALAMVRREVEPPATVTVRWDGTEVPATVVA
jgi:folate-binding protein YgfZ